MGKKKTNKKHQKIEGGHILFSRSHLNISFKNIDLFCVTYTGPFFVIKRENGAAARGPSSLLSLPRSCGNSLRARVRVCICAANEREAVMMKRG